MDTTAPTVTGITNGTQVLTEVTWNWDCDEGNCTFIHAVSSDVNTEPVGIYNSTNSKLYNGISGTFYIHIRAKDSAGNVSSKITGSVVLDQNLQIPFPVFKEKLRHNFIFRWSPDCVGIHLTVIMHPKCGHH